MRFPFWIDREKQDQRRATLRLRYMLLVTGLEKYGHSTFRSIAREAGIDHSSLFYAIDRGYLTEPMAKKIEAKYGLKAEWLMAPLEAGAPATA